MASFRYSLSLWERLASTNAVPKADAKTAERL
jgi:hypothetical protein